MPRFGSRRPRRRSATSPRTWTSTWRRSKRRAPTAPDCWYSRAVAHGLLPERPHRRGGDAARRKVVKKIVAAAKDRAVAFGLVERARDHRLYNACVYAEKGKILHVHRKVHLPTYGIFDDGRYLAPGSAFDAFDTSFGKVGILICEDAWHMASSYLLFLQNADLILCPSASPGRGLDERGEVSSLRAWQSVLEALSQLFQTYVAYCNRVGVEDGMSFFGGSRVVDPFGSVVAQVGGLDPGAATRPTSRTRRCAARACSRRCGATSAPRWSSGSSAGSLGSRETQTSAARGIGGGRRARALPARRDREVRFQKGVLGVSGASIRPWRRRWRRARSGRRTSSG